MFLSETLTATFGTLAQILQITYNIFLLGSVDQSKTSF